MYRMYSTNIDDCMSRLFYDYSKTIKKKDNVVSLQSARLNTHYQQLVYISTDTRRH